MFLLAEDCGVLVRQLASTIPIFASQYGRLGLTSFFAYIVEGFELSHGDAQEVTKTL